MIIITHTQRCVRNGNCWQWKRKRERGQHLSAAAKAQESTSNTNKHTQADVYIWVRVCECLRRNQFQILRSLLWTFQAENWTSEGCGKSIEQKQNLTNDYRWQKRKGKREREGWRGKEASKMRVSFRVFLLFALHLQIEFIGPRWNWCACSSCTSSSRSSAFPSAQLISRADTPFPPFLHAFFTVTAAESRQGETGRERGGDWERCQNLNRHSHRCFWRECVRV